ncbi:hypothetical protein Tco_0804698 [Tanacetum coccineum]|uniref:Uncharacterized protein n=1 Tax=Tanacetum coccineum TaxID=301880 RepID=A0ABQ5A5W9_9ASTR
MHNDIMVADSKDHPPMLATGRYAHGIKDKIYSTVDACKTTQEMWTTIKRMHQEPIPDEATNEEHVSTPSYDPPQSGEDRLQLTELMSLCTSLQEKVLDLEKAKTAQANEISSLKKRVKQLEKRNKLRALGLKRLRKVCSASKIESFNDVSLGAQEDASKQGRKIADLDADVEVTLIDETQESNDKEMLFDVQDDLQGEEVVAEKEVAEKESPKERWCMILQTREDKTQQKGKDGNGVDMLDNICEDGMKETVSTLRESDAH